MCTKVLQYTKVMALLLHCPPCLINLSQSASLCPSMEMTRSAKSAWLGGHLAENHWSPTSHLSPGDDILLLLAHPGLDDVGADEAGGHDNQTVKGFAAALSIPMF